MKWKKQFKDEFGIHFKQDELQFALAFISDLLKEKPMKKQNTVREIYKGEIWFLRLYYVVMTIIFFLKFFSIT